MILNNRIYTAFETIRAETALKQKTLDSVTKKHARFTKKHLIIAFCFAACLLLFLFGNWFYKTPTVYISFDINPSLELGINRFDIVTQTKALNNDGQNLIDQVDVNGLTYEDALEKLMDSEKIQMLLSQNETLDITVTGKDEQQTDRILNGARKCTQNQNNTNCHKGSMEHRHEAQSLGLSNGRYKIYQQLKEFDPSILPEDIQNMTMKELHQKLSSYQATSHH